MWFRVFSTSMFEPAPACLLEHLQGHGFAVRGDFRGDELGWFRAALAVDGEDKPLELQRYLVTEEGIRPELSTWAAWLETREAFPLMDRMIATAQLFTLQCPDASEDAALEAFGVALCRFLAQTTDGVYQIDGRGFYAADGTLLVAEEAAL